MIETNETSLCLRGAFPSMAVGPSPFVKDLGNPAQQKRALTRAWP
jgi:hypothetical protein